MSSLWDDLAAEEAEAAKNNVYPFNKEVPGYMDNVPPYDEEKDDDPLPGCADPSDWIGHNAPHRRFIIDGWIVRGSAGLLSGMEGVGKSLIAQQMATCAAVYKSFLGLEMEHVNAVYISCEDDMDELWRRQESINKALGITMEDIAGKLKLVSLKGELGNELGTFDQAGRLTASKRFRQIRAVCLAMNAGLVFLDNAAHMFTGNENARHDVAAFLGLLEQLSILIDGAVILLAHPNKQFAQGNTQGNEYSGSTGWSAHVRNRLFLDYRADPGDGTPVDDDDRVLRKSKANYGKKGEEVFFRWHEWAFSTAEDIPDHSAEMRKAAEASADNAIFMRCMEARNNQKRAVSESKKAGNFAPKEFAEMAESKGVGRARLEKAMDRLFRIGAIERGYLFTYKGEGKSAFGLRPVDGFSPAKASESTSENIKTPKPNLSETVQNQTDSMGAESHRVETGETVQNQTDSISDSMPKTSDSLSPHTPPQTPPARARAPTREGEALGLASAREAWKENPILNPDFERDDMPIAERDDDYTPIEWGDDE